MPEKSEIEQQRFEVMVLFVARETRSIGHFGRTKLAKVLFYSDFEAYREEGQSLTGATYIRMPFGPFPEPLDDAEASLSKQGYVHLDYIKGEFEEKRLVLLDKPLPDFNLFYTDWQLRRVRGWVNQVAWATAREISRLSHWHPGWRLAGKTREPIPYETAYLPQGDPPSLAAAEHARKLGRERGWLTDEGWIWEREPT